MVKENYRSGDLLCAPCLVQIPALSHLLLTSTLQGQCHCPLSTGKKTRGQWVCRMSFRLWPLCGPYVPTSGDSDSEGLAWDSFPDGCDRHPGLGVTALKCFLPNFLSAGTTRAEMPLPQDQMMLRYVPKSLRAFLFEREMCCLHFIFLNNFISDYKNNAYLLKKTWGEIKLP